MNYNDLKDLPHIEIPNLATGKQTPFMAQLAFEEMKRQKEEYERKRQFRHDWLIATFSAISGALFGFLSSLIFWLIEK